MPFKCPNCDTVHEKVTGYVPQETLQKRINAKAEENKLLADRIATLETQVGESAGYADTIRELRAKLEANEASVAFGAEGVDESVQPHFRVLYESAIAGVDDPPGFVDWIKSEDAREHPLLKPHFGVTNAPAPPREAAPTTPTEPEGPTPVTKRTLPNTQQGTVEAPTANPKVTAADVYTFMSTPQWKALGYEKRKALRNEMRAAMDAGTLTALPTLPSSD